MYASSRSCALRFHSGVSVSAGASVTGCSSTEVRELANELTKSWALGDAADVSTPSPSLSLVVACARPRASSDRGNDGSL